MTPALHAIGLAAGAALCGLLGLMQLRVDRTTGGPSGYQILWVVGFVWTFGSFLRYTLPLAGMDATATSVRLADTLAWSSAILGPLAIGRFLQAGIGKTSRASRLFLAFTGAVSLLNLVLLVWAGATHSFDVDTSWYPQTSFYVALVVTAIALLVYRAASRIPMKQSHRSPAGSAAARSCLPWSRSQPPCSPYRAPGCPRRCCAPGPDQRTLGHSLVDTGRRVAGADSFRGPGAQAQSVAAGERVGRHAGQPVRFPAIGFGPGGVDTGLRGADAERTAAHPRAEFSGRSDIPGSPGLRGGGQGLRGIGGTHLRSGATVRARFADGANHAAPRRPMGSGRRGCRAARAGVGLDRTGWPPRSSPRSLGQSPGAHADAAGVRIPECHRHSG